MPSPNGSRTGSRSRTWHMANTTPLSARFSVESKLPASQMGAPTDWTEYRLSAVQGATSSSRALAQGDARQRRLSHRRNPQATRRKQNPSVSALALERMKLRSRWEKWLFASAFACSPGPHRPRSSSDVNPAHRTSARPVARADHRGDRILLLRLPGLPMKPAVSFPLARHHTWLCRNPSRAGAFHGSVGAFRENCS